MFRVSKRPCQHTAILARNQVVRTRGILDLDLIETTYENRDYNTSKKRRLKSIFKDARLDKMFKMRILKDAFEKMFFRLLKSI